MPAKRSINENSGFLGGGKGNGPSMASNILDVLADFIERAGGRIFTQNLHPRMLHPPAIRLSHLHPDLEKVIVLCRRFGYLNPVSRHQRSPSQQRKLSFGLFLARQFRVCRDLRRSVNHRNRRGEPVRRPLLVSVRAFRSSPSCHRNAFSRGTASTRARRRGGRCRCDGRPRRRQSCPRPHRHCQRPRAGLPPDP